MCNINQKYRELENSEEFRPWQELERNRKHCSCETFSCPVNKTSYRELNPNGLHRSTLDPMCKNHPHFVFLRTLPTTTIGTKEPILLQAVKKGDISIIKQKYELLIVYPSIKLWYIYSVKSIFKARDQIPRQLLRTDLVNNETTNGLSLKSFILYTWLIYLVDRQDVFPMEETILPSETNQRSHLLRSVSVRQSDRDFVYYVISTHIIR